jgi:hypothetical protein
MVRQAMMSSMAARAMTVFQQVLDTTRFTVDWALILLTVAPETINASRTPATRL